MRDPRIIAQSSDPRFAQQNPRMVRIRTLRLTYILLLLFTAICTWYTVNPVLYVSSCEGS